MHKIILIIKREFLTRVRKRTYFAVYFLAIFAPFCQSAVAIRSILRALAAHCELLRTPQSHNRPPQYARLQPARRARARLILHRIERGNAAHTRAVFARQSVFFA